MEFFTLETLIIQSLILLFIIYILNKFVFKPYLKYLDEWTSKQEKLEEDYKNIDFIIKDAEKNREIILDDARKKANEIIKDSENIAKQKSLLILSDAEKQASNLLEIGRLDLDKEKLSMLSGVKNKLVDLILAFNKKIFKEENLNRDFIEKELVEFKK